MKEQIVTLLTILLLTGCITGKKIAGYVEPNLVINKAKVDTVMNSDFVFDFTALDSAHVPVQYTKLKSQFIPALFYWQWNWSFHFQIDQQIVAQLFKEDFLYFADGFKLKDRLKGRKLEVKLTKIPNSFVYVDKGNAIMYIYGYAMTSSEAICPENQSLAIEFKLIDGEKTVHEGALEVGNSDQPLQNRWVTTKMLTNHYIDQFKQNNKRMTVQIVEDLLAEILNEILKNI